MQPDERKPAASDTASGAEIVGLVGATGSRCRRCGLAARAFAARVAMLLVHIGPEMVAVLALRAGAGR